MSSKSLGIALVLLASSCIAPSVMEPAQRGQHLVATDLEWSVAAQADLPGTYVSTELSGPLAAVLRKVVYLFESGGTYTGAGLVDDDPPHFEVMTGRWTLDAGSLVLDGGPPASIEVAQDGSLRLSGEEGSVVLRRERDQ